MVSTKQSKDITIKNYYEVFTAIDLDNIRQFWEITSNKLEYKQMSRESATQQETVRYYSNFEGYYLPPYLSYECTYKPFINILNDCSCGSTLSFVNNDTCAPLPSFISAILFPFKSWTVLDSTVMNVVLLLIAR